MLPDTVPGTKMFDIIIGPHHEKTCLPGLRTTQVQTSLRIPADCSAPLLFVFLESIIMFNVNLLQVKIKFSS